MDQDFQPQGKYKENMMPMEPARFDIKDIAYSQALLEGLPVKELETEPAIQRLNEQLEILKGILDQPGKVHPNPFTEISVETDPRTQEVMILIDTLLEGRDHHLTFVPQPDREKVPSVVVISADLPRQNSELPQREMLGQILISPQDKIVANAPEPDNVLRLLEKIVRLASTPVKFDFGITPLTEGGLIMNTQPYLSK